MLSLGFHLFSAVPGLFLSNHSRSGSHLQATCFDVGAVGAGGRSEEGIGILAGQAAATADKTQRPQQKDGYYCDALFHGIDLSVCKCEGWVGRLYLST